MRTNTRANLLNVEVYNGCAHIFEAVVLVWLSDGVVVIWLEDISLMNASSLSDDSSCSIHINDEALRQDVGELWWTALTVGIGEKCNSPLECVLFRMHKQWDVLFWSLAHSMWFNCSAKDDHSCADIQYNGTTSGMILLVFNSAPTKDVMI